MREAYCKVWKGGCGEMGILQVLEKGKPLSPRDQVEGEAEAMRLLRRVAFERDPEAYAKLFELYQTPAYNLAFRILGHRDLAEEATQESIRGVQVRAECPARIKAQCGAVHCVWKTPSRSTRS